MKTHTNLVYSIGTYLGDLYDLDWKFGGVK